MDLREKLLSDIKMGLVCEDYTKEDIDKIEMVFIRCISDYEIANRCTDVVPFDNGNDDLINLYCCSLVTEGKSRNTIKAYRRELVSLSDYCNKNLLEITTIDIRMYMASFVKSVKQGTYVAKKDRLSAFYSWLFREEMIEKNPMLKVKVKKEKKQKLDCFTDEEIDSLQAACKTLRQRAMLEVLASSGLREEELCNLNRDDINFVTREVIVRNGKGGKSRTTYISNVCKKHLAKYLESRSDNLECMFVSNYKRRISCSTVARDLKKISRIANVQDCHAHKFRHTVASRLAERGMSIQYIQELLGHESVDTTMIYVRSNKESIKHAYDMNI